MKSTDRLPSDGIDHDVERQVMAGALAIKAGSWCSCGMRHGSRLAAFPRCCGPPWRQPGGCRERLVDKDYTAEAGTGAGRDAEPPTTSCWSARCRQVQPRRGSVYATQSTPEPLTAAPVDVHVFDQTVVAGAVSTKFCKHTSTSPNCQIPGVAGPGACAIRLRWNFQAGGPAGGERDATATPSTIFIIAGQLPACLRTQTLIPTSSGAGHQSSRCVQICGT